MNQLEGRTALVTGASRGIGKAIALAFAEQGADVALLARDTERLGQVAALIRDRGRKALVVTCDVTDREALKLGIDVVFTELGGLDIVVNNAGGNSFSSPFATMRRSGWEKTMELNLGSTYEVCQAVGPRLLEAKRGSVINVASVAGLMAVPTMAHYGAAKAAVLSLTKTLAVEWAWAGVRVNALVPGWIETDLTEYARSTPEVGQSLLSRVPMGRWGKVEEMTGPAIFLASDASSFVTGQALVADGGLMAG